MAPGDLNTAVDTASYYIFSSGAGSGTSTYDTNYDYDSAPHAFNGYTGRTDPRWSSRAWRCKNRGQPTPRVYRRKKSLLKT